MNSREPASADRAPQHDQTFLEEILSRFEHAWAEGTPPRLADFLPASGSEDHFTLLTELIKIDLEYRWKQSSAPLVLEDYLHLHPELRGRAAMPVDLVCEEYRVRHRFADRPPHEAYAARFPEHAATLPEALRRVDRELAAEASHSTSEPSTLHPDTPLSQEPTASHVSGTGGPDRPPGETARALPGTDDLAIPGYELLGILGRGGMGVVYRARQIRAGRMVALKMTLPGQGDGDHRSRFLREIQAVASLEHAQIVRLYETGEVSGRLYFAQEFVPGGTLAEKFAGTPQPPAGAAALVATLARGIHHAHEQGVIHRDLKPGNVLLAADGVPKVADFGLAKLLHEEGDLTRTAQCLGTPSYMAPEQAGGVPAAITPATDVYALGAILYEALTGRPPFKGNSVFETLEMVRSEEPVPPRLLVPRLPRDLETITLKCLEKVPARRYAAASALAGDLDRFLDGRPIAARPVGRLERGWKLVRRYPARSAVLTLSLLFLIAAPAVGLFLWQERRSGAVAAEQAAVNKYFRNIALADREWAAGQWQHAHIFLEQCAPELRRWEWHYLQRRMASETHVLRGHEGQAYAVAWTRDRTTLASAGQDGTIRLWDALSGHPRAVLRGHKGGVVSLAAGPGPVLYSGGPDGTVREWDTVTSKEVRRFGRLKESVHSLAYCPDHGLLAAGCSLMTVTVWDTTAGGKEIATLGPEVLGKGPWPCDVALTPDGKYLAATGLDNKDTAILVWDLAGRRSVFRQTLPRRHFQRVAFSPDGKILAVSSNARDERTALSSEVVLFDWATGQRLQTLRGHSGAVHAICFSPSGRFLATTGLDRSVRLWDVATAEPVVNLRTPSETAREHPGLAFHPDGIMLALACRDGTVRILNAGTDQGTATFSRKFLINAVAYSPDGKWLASAGADGAFTVRDRETGGEVFAGEHRGPWRGTLSLSLHPDNDRLATAAKDEHVCVWSISSRQKVLTLPHPKANCVLFSPDGRRIATAGDDPTVRVWETETGKEVQRLSGHTDRIFALSFHPNGTLLASAGGDRTARVWDLGTGDAILVLQEHAEEVPCVAFSPNGKLLAAGSDRFVHLWDAGTGQERTRLIGHALKVTAVAWHCDGERLLTASDDKTVKIWDPERQVEILTLAGHRGGVATLAVDPHGQFLASGGWDGAVRQWDGRCLNRDK